MTEIRNGLSARIGLSAGAMWSAFQRRDARYDGLFVTAVRTTRIFCRPSCTCRRPLRENVRFYRTPREAARAGYRPCKRCRPELRGGTAEADRILASGALAYMRAHLDQPLYLRDIAGAVAVSPSHFSRRFRAADGRTPMRALADLRAEHAESILLEGMGTLEAGLASGFESASAFTRAFRRRTGFAPAHWLKQRQGGSRE